MDKEALVKKILASIDDETRKEVMQVLAQKQAALDNVNSVNEYLKIKRPAYNAMTTQARLVKQVTGQDFFVEMSTKGRVCGRSGVREVYDGEGHQYITDTDENWNGNNLGPNGPVNFLAGLNGCLLHTVTVVAAEQNLDIDRVECDLDCIYYPVAGYEGFEDLPIGPYKMHGVLRVDSGESDERLRQLMADVGRRCPIGNLLKERPEMRIENIRKKD